MGSQINADVEFSGAMIVFTFAEEFEVCASIFIASLKTESVVESRATHFIFLKINECFPSKAANEHNSRWSISLGRAHSLGRSHKNRAATSLLPFQCYLSSGMQGDLLVHLSTKYSHAFSAIIVYFWNCTTSGHSIMLDIINFPVLILRLTSRTLVTLSLYGIGYLSSAGTTKWSKIIGRILSLKVSQRDKDNPAEASKYSGIFISGEQFSLNFQNALMYWMI